MLAQDRPIAAPAVDTPADLLHALAMAQATHDLFPTHPSVDAQPIPVVMGVSGGVDSVCLLHALRQLATPWRLALHVAHLDHALRPDSQADADFVAELAEGWGLPCYTHRLPEGALQGQPGGVEAAARRARYQFLCATAINVTPAGKVPMVAVAHHADDQAETFLHHLLRGSGLQGLGAMRPITELRHEEQTVRLVRPLLNVRRAAIETYGRAHALAWRNDETNRQTHFLRNRLRHDILPHLAQVNPSVVETLARTADLLAADYARLARLDGGLLADLRTADAAAEGPVVLDLTRLLALDLSAQRGVLRQALAKVAPSDAEFGLAHVEALLAAIRRSQAASGPHPIGAGLAWSVAGATPARPARLSIHQAAALPFAPDHPHLGAAWRATVGALKLPAEGVAPAADGWRLAVTRRPIEPGLDAGAHQSHPWAATLDASAVGEPALTTPRAGMRFAPLGMEGRRKAVGDLFTDRKVPTALRPGWPLVIDAQSGRVLWVCGLAVSHAARLTASTREVLALCWEHAGGEPLPCAPT
ncbi:MAG: tRNA lysidine(34) synthetase TilS [Caldilineaceae bacterium]|nr:tRNA lysidine(34) synthetase TilS [Caldilineaceae bacterium]